MWWSLVAGQIYRIYNVWDEYNIISYTSTSKTILCTGIAAARQYLADNMFRLWHECSSTIQVKTIKYIGYIDTDTDTDT